MKIRDIIQEDSSAGASSASAVSAMPTTIGNVIKRPSIFAVAPAISAYTKKKKLKKSN